MQTKNEISRADPVIDFVIQELQHAQGKLKDSEIKEKIESALTSWYIERKEEHNVNPERVNELYSLYMQRVVSRNAALTSETLSEIERLCDSYSVPSLREDLVKRLDAEFKKIGFDSRTSTQENQYYQKIDLETKCVTHIFPKGIFRSTGGYFGSEDYTIPGTYILKIPFESADKVKEILSRETDGNNSANWLSTIASGIVLGGPIIYGLGKAMDIDSVLIAAGILLGYALTGTGASLAVVKLHDILKNKTQKTVHAKLAEELKQYLSPELSSGKQYDFNIIRKALE
jgi:hypothetical protein